jgi:hypothetical protein
MELLILILLVIVIVLLVQKKGLKKKIASIVEEGNIKISSKNEEIEELRNEIGILAKYRSIIDVENEIARRRTDSNLALAKMRQEATEFTKSEREKAKRIKELAEKKIEEAHTLSDRIVSDAKMKAIDIAGEAWEAKKNADQYAETARAMSNIINGYGDEYLIPGESLLDELAEDYDHTEAGRELANVRSLIKSMIKNGAVADCGYVEHQRRTAAIDFVIDAFNGKVDSIMSKVRHDNYGILLQRLNDAYSIVNHNGKPFRNARIIPKYFDVIKDQLRLAVTVSELKKKDREEQKAIREAMREEERARREYEKALKASQKEEKILAKALKEAEARVQQANEEERAVYELKLQELQQELQEAILKGQRALSMAQQTKRGHVYVISNIGSFGENVFKIGLTRRLEPMDRVKELGDASVPFSFDVHAMIHSEDAPTLERELQSHFGDYQMNKVNPRKEFFKVPLSEIKEKVQSMDLSTHWTMKAEALEYRESMQIAKNKISAS